tara:strand:- start:75 stop:359 length:285 start_codon:yes stop_codon:yes gene_type:complete
MSYSIQNKLCDDVLGLVKSFRGKTHKEILFNECLEDLNNNPNLKDYLRNDWEWNNVSERFTRKYFNVGYYYDDNGKKKIMRSPYLFTQDGTQIR